jgi:DNA-binding protein HU-beta
MAKKKAKKKASKKAAKKSKAKKSTAKKAAKKTTKKAKKKAGRRTTLRSSKGTKLYAVRAADGTFKDIQTYKRAHSADMARRAAAEDQPGNPGGIG